MYTIEELIKYEKIEKHLFKRGNEIADKLYPAQMGCCYVDEVYFQTDKKEVCIKCDDYDGYNFLIKVPLELITCYEKKFEELLELEYQKLKVEQEKKEQDRLEKIKEQEIKLLKRLKEKHGE